MLFEDFHFLRPVWLCILILLPLIIWRLSRIQGGHAIWKNVCDSHLLPHLLKNMHATQSRWPLLVLSLAWLLATLALAGPVWEKQPQAVFKTQQANVFILDLSPSMNAADLKPSRIQQAHFKLLDALKRNPDGQNALLAYSGDSHIVTPLSSDSDTIANLVPSLVPELMPSPGDALDDALKQAQQLLAQADVHQGHIIVLTDSLEHAEAVQEQVKMLVSAGHKISILGMGTAQGAPVSLPGGGYLKDAQGAIVMPRLPSHALQELAQQANGRYSPFTLDERDLAYLLPQNIAQDAQMRSEEQQQVSDTWYEEGPWLVLALLPLAALGWRRGWLFSLSLLPVLSFYPQSDLQAWEWRDLWERQAQQAEQAMREEDYQRAAELYQDPEHQGSAYYRAGDYAAAAQAFAQAEGARADYNRGNALAKLGDLEGAIAAYQKALAQQPDYPTAQKNLELVQQLAEQQKQQEQQQDQQKDQQQDQKNQQDKQDKQEQQDQQQSADNQDQQPGEDQQDQQNQQADQQSQDSEQQQAQQGEQGESQQDSQQQTAQEQNGQQGQESQSSESESQSAQQESQQAQQDAQDAAQQAQDSQQAQSQDAQQQEALEQAQQAQAEADKQQDAEREAQAAAQAQQAEQADDQQGQPVQATMSSEEELTPEQREQQQALQYWLNRVPDDPGGLLRRKFALEAQRRQQQRSSGW